MIQISRVVYNDLRVRDNGCLLLLILLMIDIELVLRVSQASSAAAGGILSRWNPISYHLLLNKDRISSACSRLCWDSLLLALGSETILIDLSIVVKIIEHEV
jgi:hypothetical protein